MTGKGTESLSQQRPGPTPGTRTPIRYCCADQEALGEAGAGGWVVSWGLGRKLSMLALGTAGKGTESGVKCEHLGELKWRKARGRPCPRGNRDPGKKQQGQRVHVIM